VTQNGKRAAFLDRDGTIIEDVPYNSDPDRVALLAGADRAIRKLNEQGYLVVVTTNQSGVARGYYTEEDIRAVNARMVGLLAEGGARIDRIYYCPHLPAELVPPGQNPCDCRKPAVGMVERACRELNIDPSRSLFFGDRLSDVEMGKRAGGTVCLVLTGNGEVDAPAVRKLQDVVIARDLLAGVEQLLRGERS
jgi:D-glycero-D-manno-heptose 1,7-bisphosphate phosphatase